VWCYRLGARRHPPTECHRTIKADIRSHLYGGPQGWNPHSVRIAFYSGEGHKPFGPAWRSVRRETVRPPPAAFASHPSAPFHLRASDRPASDSPDVGPCVFISESPLPYKGVGSIRVGFASDVGPRVFHSESPVPFKGTGWSAFDRARADRCGPAPRRISSERGHAYKCVVSSPPRHAITMDRGT